MDDRVYFHGYLQSILNDEDYLEWQEIYTPTTAEGRKPLPHRKFSNQLKLRVETVKSEGEQGSRGAGELKQQAQIERWDVLAGLRHYAADHVVLMGKPGSGKSTSLERLLWEEAEDALKKPDAKIPVLVKLRRCTSTIEHLIQDFFSCHQLPLEIPHIENLLRQGKLLLLLDGLNELPETFGTEVANFRDRYRKTTPMIVSTRDLSVGGTLGITKTLKMLPLREPQMQEFVQGYLGEEGNRLLQQLKGDRLRKFAETPLLLWMLCRVFAQNGQVPANLGLAFREFTQLYDQQLQADAPTESREQWPKLLRHLAFALMHDRDPVEFRLSMPREEAETLLTDCLQQEGRAHARESAERWLQDMLNYHLIQPVRQPNFEEHIEFRHQLIQEYYAAEYLLRLLPDLSDEQLKRNYLNLLKWTEPIALMLALVDKEAQALRVVKLAMDDVNLMLGARLSGKVHIAFQEKAVDWITEWALPEFLQVKLLEKNQTEFAIPTLLKLLHKAHSHVRNNAAKALGKVGNEPAIDGLIKAFHLDPLVRYKAAEALGIIGSKQAINALLTALKNENWDVCESAVWGLSKISNDQAINGLITALEHPNVRVRISAVRSLRVISNERSTNELLAALQHWDDSVRREAAEALGIIASKQAISGLLAALQHWDANVRKKTVAVLGIIGNEDAINGLLAALQHWDDSVRIEAAEALGIIGSKQAINGLLAALEDHVFEVRGRAVEALGKIGNEQAINGLLVTFQDQDSYVRSKAAEALGKIGGEKAISGLLSAFDDQNSFFRVRTIMALGEIASAKAITALFSILDGQNPFFRSKAAEALGKIGDERSTNRLLVALQDQDPNIRCTVAEALGKIGNEQAISGLLAALQDQDTCGIAAYSLEKIGGEEAIDGLLVALQDQAPNLRWSAASVLGEIGNERAINGLLVAVQDQAFNVRWSAVKALGKIGIGIPLAHLWQLYLTGRQELLSIITTIQNRCKFYNYEIFHNIIPSGKIISLYFSYASADEVLQTQLANHLTLLKRQGIITSWSNRQILPGDEPAQVINQQLNTADIILLLISANSMADDTCYDIEIQRAIERHQAGEAYVIPILLRPVDWVDASFSQLELLPKNHQSVTLWDNQDEAFQETAEAIRAVAMKIRKKKGEGPT